MHKVRGLKTLSASFFIARALSYLAAFNMVGWNFLVPGQYTFGIVCTIFLLVITPIDAVVADGGFALALIVVSSLQFLYDGDRPVAEYASDAAM